MQLGSTFQFLASFFLFQFFFCFFPPFCFVHLLLRCMLYLCVMDSFLLCPVKYFPAHHFFGCQAFASQDRQTAFLPCLLRSPQPEGAARQPDRASGGPGGGPRPAVPRAGPMLGFLWPRLGRRYASPCEVQQPLKMTPCPPGFGEGFGEMFSGVEEINWETWNWHQIDAKEKV